MFQNKHLLLFFFAIFINYEYYSSCPVSWSPGNAAPPTPPITTTFTVNQNIGTYIVNLGAGASLTSQVAQDAYSAVTAGVSAIPEVGPAISAIMSFFGPLFGGDSELDLTPLFQEFANYMDKYVAQTEYVQQILNVKAFYQGAVNSIQYVDGANIEEQYNALESATNFLASAQSIYLDEEVENVIFKYAYYSMDSLYMTALLHTNTAVGMIAAQAQIEASDVSNLYNKAQIICSTYTTLLQNYQSQAVSWRENEISGLEEEYADYACDSGEVDPEYRFTWNDNVSGESYYNAGENECNEYEVAICPEEMNEWHSDYKNNVVSSTQEQLQIYVTQYQTICNSLTTSQNIDMETIDAELNNLITSFQGM